MDDILTLKDPRTRSGYVYSDKKRNDFCYQTASHCITTVTNLYHMPLSQPVYINLQSCVSANLNQQNGFQGMQYCMGYLLHVYIIPQTPLATYLIIP